MYMAIIILVDPLLIKQAAIKSSSSTPTPMVDAGASQGFPLAAALMSLGVLPYNMFHENEPNE